MNIYSLGENVSIIYVRTIFEKSGQLFISWMDAVFECIRALCYFHEILKQGERQLWLIPFDTVCVLEKPSPSLVALILHSLGESAVTVFIPIMMLSFAWKLLFIYFSVSQSFLCLLKKFVTNQSTTGYSESEISFYVMLRTWNAFYVRSSFLLFTGM